MSDEPKWITQLKRVAADAHKSATDPLADHVVGIQALRDQLAAEREKRADWNVVIEDLEQQLAAEREERKDLIRKNIDATRIASELSVQLAAEREKPEHNLTMDTIYRLDKQLADAREKVQHIVALLENPKFDNWDRRELLKALRLTGAQP